MLAVAIALLHAAGLALLFRSPPPRDPVLDEVLTLVAVPAASARQEPLPPPPLPPDPVVVEVQMPIVLVAAPPADAIASPSPSPGSGPDCAIDRVVTDALSHDPAALAILATLGPDTRAVTGAVMLWNGAWTVATNPADARALAGLRPRVAEAIMRARAACRSADVTGPRLIVVPAPNRTTMLAIGSGVWRWEQLLAADGR